MNSKSDIKLGSEIYILIWRRAAAVTENRVYRFETCVPLKGTVQTVRIGTAENPTESVYYTKFVGFDFFRQMFSSGFIQLEPVRETDPIFRDIAHAKAYGRWLRRHYSRRQSGDRFRQLNS